MGASIFKQPNGLLGRYSYVSDGFTNLNMSEEEYIISRFENSIQDSKDNLKRCIRLYKDIIKDAESHIALWDEYIKEAESEEERKNYIDEKKNMEEELQKYKETMNNPSSKEQNSYNEFFKEMLQMIDNLCIYYNTEDWNYIKKDYLPIEYPFTDLVEFTRKIKEINELYNKLKESHKKA